MATKHTLENMDKIKLIKCVQEHLVSLKGIYIS